MIPYLPCESARELLESFIDRELSTADQVAVEAHLRSCRTCAARVDDLSLIGWSLRSGTPATSPAQEDVRSLGVMQSGVLERIRAERQQSLRGRLPELFSDMRLWWPALGASAAVIVCLMGAAGIWRLTTDYHPGSLAGTIAALENPGCDRNPLPLDAGISVPRSLDEGLVSERISADDAAYVFVAVITQSGEIGEAELVRARYVASPKSVAAALASDAQPLLDAVRGSRYTPAQAANGRAVAVRLLMLFERTTIRETMPPPIEEPTAVQQARRSATPKASPVQRLPGARSAVVQSSARA
jgi:hypothetical protein